VRNKWGLSDLPTLLVPEKKFKVRCSLCGKIGHKKIIVGIIQRTWKAGMTRLQRRIVFVFIGKKDILNPSARRKRRTIRERNMQKQKWRSWWRDSFDSSWKSQ
jgi:hypothetical protein